MPKPMYVWSGSAWVSVATEVESLAGYATQSYADNATGSKLVVPTSVAVGSGSGSVATQGTVTFSAASSVSVNNVFSSTYQNYLVQFKGGASADTTLRMNLRVGGVDNTTASSYGLQRVNADSTTLAAARSTTTYWDSMNVYSTQDNIFNLTISNPFATEFTLINASNTKYNVYQAFGGFHNQNTSYDGFTFTPASGTITGTVRVYGYKIG
jgi:hypothetical protein